MSREFPVAVGRADCKAASMGIDDCAGVIRTNRERPDGLDTPEVITPVANILWFQRRLSPFVKHTTQVRNRQIRIGNHAVGPILIERTQIIGLLARGHRFPPLKDSGVVACAGEFPQEEALRTGVFGRLVAGSYRSRASRYWTGLPRFMVESC